MPSNKCVAIILAAGQSRRFGDQDKRLHILPNGQTMLSAVYAKARQVFDDVVVVIHPADRADFLGLPAEVKSIKSVNCEQGIGCSLADAFKYLCHKSEYKVFSTAAVMLADMPFIQILTLKMLKKKACRDKITRSIYMYKDGKGVKGHPVIFGRNFWSDLEGLKGDKGAKEYLSLYCDQVSYVQVQDLGVTYDVDYPESSMGWYEPSMDPLL